MENGCKWDNHLGIPFCIAIVSLSSLGSGTLFFRPLWRQGIIMVKSKCEKNKKKELRLGKVALNLLKSHEAANVKAS